MYGSKEIDWSNAIGNLEHVFFIIYILSKWHLALIKGNFASFRKPVKKLQKKSFFDQQHLAQTKKKVNYTAKLRTCTTNISILTVLQRSLFRFFYDFNKKTNSAKL